MNTLKGCPFCGAGEDFVDANVLYPHPFAKSGFIVSCRNCGATMTDYDRSHVLSDVKSKWNKRHRPIEKIDILDALLKGIDGLSIAARLRWSLSGSDLILIGKLYELGKFKTQIEELLKESNFHTEARLLKEGRFDEYFAGIVSSIMKGGDLE